MRPAPACPLLAYAAKAGRPWTEFLAVLLPPSPIEQGQSNQADSYKHWSSWIRGLNEIAIPQGRARSGEASIGVQRCSLAGRTEKR